MKPRHATPNKQREYPLPEWVYRVLMVTVMFILLFGEPLVEKILG